MAREKWLIDPTELDEFQVGIRELSIDASYVIKGCAGSGKTILALYRANDIRIDAEASGKKANFTVLVYTKTLRSFIRSGIRELKIGLNQVIHYKNWDGNPVDYIVIDEAQDFTEAELDEIIKGAKKSLMFYGDSHQRLYLGGMMLEDIAKKQGIPEKELLKNYRLPKLIAEFASYLGDDRHLASKCIKTGTTKPIVHQFGSWQQELDFIINEIQLRNYTDVGILLPFNTPANAKERNQHRNVKTVINYFDQKKFTYEYKMREDDSDTIELDFESNNPKVLPFHSSKGLQFETVFVPFIDYPNHDWWFKKYYRKPLYVALTRSYRNLYLTHTNEVNPFFGGIPRTAYD